MKRLQYIALGMLLPISLAMGLAVAHNLAEPINNNKTITVMFTKDKNEIDFWELRQ